MEFDEEFFESFSDLIDSYIDKKIKLLYKNKKVPKGLRLDAVNFSNAQDVWEENKDKLRHPFDIFGVLAIEGYCYLKVDAWFGKQPIYSSKLNWPTWLDVVLFTNATILESGDTDHCFIESLYKSDEVKDGYPVYQIHLGS